MKNSHIEMSLNEIDDVVNQLDLAHNHKINYTEFISATIDIQSYLTDEKLEGLF